MAEIDSRKPTRGGPSQHAGNIYHHLYAATRVLELLDPEASVRAIYLEGLGTESAEEDVVDVAVDRYEALELIQVRWSQRPQDRPLRPSEWWEAIGRLWSRSKAVPLEGRAVELKVRTNRSASRDLLRQNGIWEEWAQLDETELILRLEGARQATMGVEHDLYQRVSELAGPTDSAAMVSVLRSIQLEAGLGNAALDDTQRLLSALLFGLHFPPDRWADTVLQRVAERCTPEWAGKPVTRGDVASWLELTEAPGMTHDIASPEAYVPFPTFAEQVNAHVGRMARSGGVLALIGLPGSGKTVQLAEWARGKGYPFYACRVDDRDDDIRQRARQRQFLIDIARGIWDRYPDRVAQRPGIAAAAASEEELRTELAGILNALGANSPEDSPAVIVIDGVDDARRALGSASFLEIIQRPPPHVVLVISAQGENFLPEWLRRPTEYVNHVSMPALPQEVAAEVVRRLMGLGAVVHSQGSGAPAPEPDSDGDVIERIVTLSAGNILVLRTICGQLSRKEPEQRLSVLDQLGDRAFAGIEDYFERILGSPSEGTLSWLRALALVRSSLTIEQVAQATDCRVEGLLPELGNVEFVLAVSDSVPRRYGLYHPSLRRFVCEQFFPDGQVTMHSNLADVAAAAPQGDPLAAELPHHLAGAERWAEVLGTINYDFLDRLFDTFSTPSQIREEVDLLTTAAARGRDLSDAVRAMLVAQKVELRLDYFLSLGGLPYSEENADFSTLMRVLLAGGQRLAATNFLREIGEPEAKFRMGCVLAQEAFVNGRVEDARFLLDIARTTALFHAPRRDLVAASADVACEVWWGKPLAELLEHVVSSQWQRPGWHGEPPQALPEEEQIDPRCETVRALGYAARMAGREQELGNALGAVPNPYRLAAVLGLCQSTDEPAQADVELVIALARQGHAWSDAVRRRVAALALDICHDSNAARDIAHLAEPLPHAPDLLTGLIGDGGMTPEEFLDLAKLRQRAGLPADFETGKAQESDRHRAGAVELYYRAGLALVRAEVAHLEGRTDQEVGELLGVACQAWAEERPYWMNWTSFFDARRSLSKLAPRLASLAFERGGELGAEVADALWNLTGWAVGRLFLEPKLRVLQVLAERPVARPWVEKRLEEAVSDIRNHERATPDRSSLLLSAADVARRLGWVGQALSLARVGLRTTKGLPPVDEEPRYYALLELADTLRKRGCDTVPLLKRVGRLIQLSHEVTNRHYAGNTWPRLISLLAQADLPAAFDLILELDHDVEDEGVPDARSSLHRLLVSAPGALSAVEWVALLWLVSAEKLDEAKELVEALVDRVETSTHRVASDQLFDWAAGALLHDLSERDGEALREAIRSRERPREQGGPDSVQDGEFVREVVKDSELVRRAEAGDPDAIHAVKDLLIDGLDQLYWSRSGLRNAFESLARLDLERARNELVKRVALQQRVFDPYSPTVVLCELPDALVSTDDLMQVVETLCVDIEDSLEVVPAEPTSRRVLQEGYSPPNRAVCDLLRDLLHNRDDAVRHRAREALGILAHESAEEVARSVARWDDLETLPTYARLTAIEMRLSVLWVVAELEPTASVKIAADIYNRCVAAGGSHSGHFLMRDYGRRICLKALEADPACLPAGAEARVAVAPSPARLRKLQTPFYRGKTSPMFGTSRDRHLEYGVEALAWLFRVPTRRAERIIQWVAAKLHQLTEEEMARDRWIMEQAYTRKSRPLRPAREELFEHAFRIVQQRWYERRAADLDNWLEDTPQDFERRRLDPWLPALLIRNVDGSGLLGADEQLEDLQWLESKPVPPPDYVTEDGWTLVWESATDWRGAKRISSTVNACLLEPAFGGSWLQGMMPAAERGLPSYSYLTEILADHDWWWSRWSYGEDDRAGQRIMAAYAEDGLAVEEPLYYHVAVPVPQLRNGLTLRRRQGGLDCVSADSGQALWRIEWYGRRSARAWARTDWLLSRLNALNLCLAIDRWQRREITEIDSYGVAVAQTGFVREWASRAVLHPEGRWDVSVEIRRD